MRAERLPYLAGLDGLRGLAVLAVFLFHADLALARGGFLGVEVFFVVSGYVITCLLLSERETAGRVSLGAFWYRRARRLLPAVYVLLVALLTYTVLALPLEVSRLREAAVAALAYVTNWYLLLDQQSYFESFGRPLVLKHLWSLAIEEQFYVVWPLLFILLCRLRRGKAALVLVLLAGASAALMALLAESGARADRLYYGTDTRAAGFLAGCALAFAWRPFLQSPLGRQRGRAIEAGGLVALAGLAACLLLLDADSALLYRGGLLLVAALTALLIAALARPEGTLARLVGAAPLRQLGLRSYSLYLWHWPVVVLTRPQVDLALEGAPLLALRVCLTLLLAEVSYRLVERPFRDGSLVGFARSLWQGVGPRRPQVVLAAFSAAVLAASGIATLIIDARPPEHPFASISSVRIVAPSPRELQPVAFSSGAATAAQLRLESQGDDLDAGTTAAGSPRQEGDEEDPLAGDTAPPPEADTESSPPAAAVPRPLPPIQYESIPARVHVTAIGDSVILGAAYSLAAYVPGLDLDAKVGRQASEVAQLLWQQRQAGRLGSVVLIAVGNNGTITAPQFREIMGTVADVPKVIFVNVTVPRPWQDANNAVVAEGVAAYPNARLVDWHAASADRPDYFWDEGVHLNSRGSTLYVSLLTQAIAAP